MQPEPERQREPGPPSPSSPAGGASYVPKPDLEPRKPGRRLAVLAAALLALGLGFGVMRQAGVQTTAPPAVTQQIAAKTLTVSRKDLDPQVLRALKSGALTPSLAAADPSLVKELRDGSREPYSVRLVDTEAEDGDVVLLLVDGKPLGHFELSNRGATLTLPLRRGQSTSLKVVAEKDGGGGVTFGAASSLGETRSRVMDVGETDAWTVTAP